MRYERDKVTPLDFLGMCLTLPPDQVPPGKFPFAMNVRRYKPGGVVGRARQDSSLFNLPTAVHSLRRLNDLTPAGPPLGYVLIAGAGTNLYAVGSGAPIHIDSTYSGNPVSLVSFRPDASVQPWMYVGDSFQMRKVRSDGTTFKMGIKEPQASPTVTFVPASDVVSLLGPVTVYIFNNPIQAHNTPLTNVYLWHGPTDQGPSSLLETAAMANVVNAGNSLLFDLTSINGSSPVGGANPVAWSQYTTYSGTVSVNGTSVIWDSGTQFNGLVAGNKIVIAGVTYTIAAAPAPTNTTLALTTSGGNQTAANYTAAVISGTVSLFAPALESEGYQDFNCSIVGTLYVPAAGTYTFAVSAKDDFLWGMGNAPNGTVSWPGKGTLTNCAGYGQTKTTINAYPLMPRTQEPSGGDGQFSSASLAVTFSAAGNYPFEIDWDYWYHLQRGLMVTCNGANIPPIPPSAITNSQYRAVYRSSATGAHSNGSPASPQSALSVLSNNMTIPSSVDPQVDKVDWYRLDQGLSNFTYVGTIANVTTLAGNVITTTTSAVTATGTPFNVQVASIAGLSVGLTVDIDAGVNLEAVTITGIIRVIGFPPEITAVFTKTHLTGVNISAINFVPPTFTDNLLDVDIAANPILEEDNFEPFPSIDLPRSGTVNVVNGVVNWASGDHFNVRWLPGTLIKIGTIEFSLNTRPTSNSQLTAENVDLVAGIETIVNPPDGIGFVYEISEPILAAQPLPYLWGPTDNVAFFFAVGDPLRPGTIYWTKGNNPDSAPDTNQQDLTSPSETLINGVWADGFGMVFASERAWLIWPNYFNALATVQGTQGNTWTFQLSACTRGLFIPRAIATDGGSNVFFRTKDGICVTVAGGAEKSITDGDLYPLFTHEGMVAQPVTLAGIKIYPPDDTKPLSQKLACASGYLYYDYLDTNGVARTLVYDIKVGAWVWDIYQHPATVHALEEGPTVNNVLTGCQDGSIRPLTNTGNEIATAMILPPSFNAGDIRAQKHWGDIYLEIDRPIS